MIIEHVDYSNLEVEVQLFVIHHGLPADETTATPLLIIPEPYFNNPITRWPCLLTSEKASQANLCSKVIVLSKMPALDDGDIVVYRKEHAQIEVVYQTQSQTNALFLTSCCNSKCQFCPQPPQKDTGEFYDLALQIIQNVPAHDGVINITGGEPTLDKTRFLSVLSAISEAWPAVKPLVLTNGRTLADKTFVRAIFARKLADTIGFAIPLYADSASVHDAIVRVNGAFGQTLRGLYNLAPYHSEIEIRVVVSKLNYKRLPYLVDYVGRNLPFISRIAVMGIEPMGYARDHWENFWIDPENTAEALMQAADIANRRGMCMLLYNQQLCCLPPTLRPIAKSTISDWKRIYIDNCQNCPMRKDCGGFFASQNAPQYLPRHFDTSYP